MNKPHKHAEVIKAWADGAQIQYCYRGCGGAAVWHTIIAGNPLWDVDTQYRVADEAVKQYILDTENQK